MMTMMMNDDGACKDHEPKAVGDDGDGARLEVTMTVR